MTLMVDIERPASTEPNVETHPHDWIAAATVSLTAKLAKHANLRGSYRTDEQGVRINVLEVYCSACRRPYDVLTGNEDAATAPCAAKINNEHLIGGNPGERKKRGPVHRGEPVTPAPAVRRGPDSRPTHLRSV